MDENFKMIAKTFYGFEDVLSEELILGSSLAKLICLLGDEGLPILTFGLTAVSEISTKKNSFRGSNFNHIYKTDFIRFNYLYFRFILAWKFNRLGKTNF